MATIGTCAVNRRGFLGALAGLAAGWSLGGLIPTRKPEIIDVVGWKVCTDAVMLNEDWVCFVHPDYMRDLFTIQAKDKWQHAYRAWRMDGKPEMSARELLANYTVKSSELYNAELGTIGGFKIITQELVRPFTV